MSFDRRSFAALGAATADACRHLARGALDLTLPPSCADCGASVERTAILCAPCDHKLRRIALDRCSLCQVGSVGAGDLAGEPNGLCGGCAKSGSPMQACISASVFGGDVENWIHRFKYPRPGLRGLDPTPRTVVRVLVLESARRAPGPAPDLVAPVPLHPSRLRSRGFNPAALLARSVAREFGARFDAVALQRIRATPSQTGLDRRGRQRNVRGAFRARRGFRAPDRVWLVDDVVTTGSTLGEAARALLRAGAKHVVGICAARSL